MILNTKRLIEKNYKQANLKIMYIFNLNTLI